MGQPRKSELVPHNREARNSFRIQQHCPDRGVPRRRLLLPEACLHPRYRWHLHDHRLRNLPMHAVRLSDEEGGNRAQKDQGAAQLEHRVESAVRER